jgi:hypothetical protein
MMAAYDSGLLIIAARDAPTKNVAHTTFILWAGAMAAAMMI